MDARREERRRWMLAIGAGAAVVGVLAALVRVPSAGPEGREGRKEGEAREVVGIARFGAGATDERLREEALLRDPAPLFLPSPWSASAEVLREDAWREPQTSFQDYPAKLKFAESQLALDLRATADVPARAGEAFGLGHSRRPFAGFGQIGGGVEALPSRTAFLEVVTAEEGQRVISQPLANAQPPGDVPWQPLEFLVAIDVRGVLGLPVLTESSRVAAVDDYFQNYIVRVLHLGERLEPGFYHVGIGP